MRNYRSNNWGNPCGEGFKFGGWTCPDEATRRVCVGIYEAGADAMLEELKKDGKYVTNNASTPYGMVLARTLKLGEKGWVIFIPDREVKK